MLSDGSSKLLELTRLEQTFLDAFQHNDLDRLSLVDGLLSRIGRDLEQASPSIVEDQAAFLSIFSHNVDVASSHAAKVQLDIEQISSRFTQSLSFLPSPTSPIASSSPSPAPAESCSSVPNVVLKEWSVLHVHDLFLSKEQLQELASQTSMSPSQITLWFRNARTRSGWSKLFAHPRVNKNHERLKTLLSEYDALKRHGSPEGFKLFLASDELVQLLDKVLLWFATTKQAKLSKAESIKPWVKEVLSNALATLKDKTAAAMDSSRQKLPSLSARKRARTTKFIPSPSPLSRSSTPIAGPSSTPSLASESPQSSTSQPTTTGSFSNSIPNTDYSQFLGSESLHGDRSSPAPVPMTDPLKLGLTTAPTTYTPDPPTDSDQFEDAEL